MTDALQPGPLATSKAILEQRHLLKQQAAERMLTDALRGAFLLNGGALIAVMPVVTAMIGSAAPARMDLRPTVLCFIAGLLLAAMTGVLAYLKADEDVDVSEYCMRPAALPGRGKGPMGPALKYGVISGIVLSIVSASSGFLLGSDELAKLRKPAPCPANEPWCNVPEIELANDVLAAMVGAKLDAAAVRPAAAPPTEAPPATIPPTKQD